MASKYNTFEWCMSGFGSQLDAEQALESNRKAFEAAHDPLEWAITTSISQGPYGWKAQYKAVKDG